MASIDARSSLSRGPSLTEAPDIDAEIAALVDAEIAVRLRAVPYAREEGRLLVAMVDPTNLEGADEISITTGSPVRRLEAPAPIIDAMLRKAYGTTASQMAARLGGAAREDAVTNLEAIEADDLHRMAEQPSLINLVNLIILEAIRARSSDIHIEPFEREISVKYRVDGVLRVQNAPPKHLQPAITSRVKIMAGMNIAERYAPQDGHITLRFEGRKIDIRVSTVPTLYGESGVMRLLDQESISLDLETLGMVADDRDKMAGLISLPHGMVLVTGPTGSGKTTSLYAALTRLYDPSRKIITIEDPVEYELNGVNQIPVNPKRGLTFANGLRHILRQDPDVVMVGEIRDGETAEIAVRAALTGHLIFSTLHTNNAISAVGRLLDMGVEPFLLSSVLEGIVAQRLGQRICQSCVTSEPIPDEVRHRLSPDEAAMFPSGGFFGAGCEKCDGHGMKGRIGYFEIIVVDGPLRRAISEGAGMHELGTKLPKGFRSMRHDGMLKASRGLTRIDAVLRATQDSEHA
ncbi:MAG: type II/IV secretion system protein [Phycisphaerales bacterium]|nr:type II/IV secretion system protein [Phycisphaerales bacterium]